jgi:hypothetical protein
VAARDAARMLAAGDDLERVGMVLTAAELAAAAADLHARAGRARPARVALAIARRRLRHCPGASLGITDEHVDLVGAHPARAGDRPPGRGRSSSAVIAGKLYNLGADESTRTSAGST